MLKKAAVLSPKKASRSAAAMPSALVRDLRLAALAGGF